MLSIVDHQRLHRLEMEELDSCFGVWTKNKMIKNNTLYKSLVKYVLENNTLYKILVKYSVAQSQELSLKMKRVLMYCIKMDWTQETSIKSKMMSTLKTARITANVKPGKSCKSQFKKLRANA